MERIYAVDEAMFSRDVQRRLDGSFTRPKHWVAQASHWVLSTETRVRRFPEVIKPRKEVVRAIRSREPASGMRDPYGDLMFPTIAQVAYAGALRTAQLLRLPPRCALAALLTPSHRWSEHRDARRDRVAVD